MILELSGEFSVKDLCEKMDISRSSFYYWKSRLNNPSTRTKTFISNILLFREYHEKYPSHGYRWLNAKIRLDTGLIVSDSYAHKCCKTARIKSKSKHYKYKKPGPPYKVYPNLLLSELNVTGPMQCIVSDMTAFYVKGIYYELTIYMDLWNNEIISHSLSSKRGDRIIRSMPKAGTSTDNGATESINSWIKAEIITVFYITDNKDIQSDASPFVKFFNEERSACSLNYQTPKKFSTYFGCNSK